MLRPTRSQDDIMREMSQQAQERGLAPAILDGIVRDNA
jgi:hypothetical protein